MCIIDMKTSNLFYTIIICLQKIMLVQIKSHLDSEVLSSYGHHNMNGWKITAFFMVLNGRPHCILRKKPCRHDNIQILRKQYCFRAEYEMGYSSP